MGNWILAAGWIAAVPLWFAVVVVGAIPKQGHHEMVTFTVRAAPVPKHSAACPWVTDHDWGEIGGQSEDQRRLSRCWEPS